MTEPLVVQEQGAPRAEHAGPIVGRLAPSPTGELHLGHALAFLASYWSARSQGGSLVLRHEDVDVERATAAHREGIRDDLLWLGLDFDRERVQSDGLERLRTRASELVPRGLAYACRCSRGDLKALGAPQSGSGEVRYPGTCRALGLSQPGNALRFLVPEGNLLLVDSVFGSVSFDVAAEVGDFPILRKNGLPSYQLAVVLDDAEDEVTEVVRGVDLLPSAARQMLLQRALGLPAVRYLHVPLVTDESGTRLAKRHASLSLRELRERGATPARVVTWVARKLGQLAPDEDLTSAQALLPRFTPSAIPRENIPVVAKDLAYLTGA